MQMPRLKDASFPLCFLMAMLLLCAPAYSAPPSDPSAVSMSDLTLESEVPMGDFLGLNFYVYNSTGGPVANHHCTISVYEWRDNVSYALAEYRLIPLCQDPAMYALNGEGNQTLADCWIQSAPNGEVYFLEKITREKGYNIAPKTGAYVGGYGSYKVEAKCGLPAAMSKTANFTVLQEKEPTWVIDWATYLIDYRAFVIAILGGLAAVAILIYIFLRLLGVYK